MGTGDATLRWIPQLRHARPWVPFPVPHTHTTRDFSGVIKTNRHHTLCAMKYHIQSILPNLAFRESRHIRSFVTPETSMHAPVLATGGHTPAQLWLCVQDQRTGRALQTFNSALPLEEEREAGYGGRGFSFVDEPNQPWCFRQCQKQDAGKMSQLAAKRLLFRHEDLSSIFRI